MVRITGVEPARTCVHMDLNHARLPIPPYPHKFGAEPSTKHFIISFIKDQLHKINFLNLMCIWTFVYLCLYQTM